MRRYGISLIMVALVGACVTAMLAAQGAEPKRYALVVGINEYDHQELAALRYCENDAKALGDRFRKAGYTRVVVLLGKQATRKNILASLKELVNGHELNDTLLVSLSGHGMHFDDNDGTEKDSHFCPYGAIPKFNRATDTLVAMGEIYELFREAKRGPKLLLVDACRNFKGKRSGVDSGTALRPPNGVLTYFSCSEGQRSHEVEALGHGLFTYAILEALDGKGGVNNQSQVTWARLMEYVPGRVETLYKEHIKGDERLTQEPSTNANLQGVAPVLVKLDRIPMPSPKREPESGEERSIEIADGVKVLVCYIPAGECQLGSPAAERAEVLRLLSEEKEPAWLSGEAEGVRGKYETKGYWLGKYEVTQDEWVAVMGSNPSWFRLGGDGEAKVAGMKTGNYPVEGVSWNDCQKFLTKVNGRAGLRKSLGGRKLARLPHEDEWEYGYRGGRGNGRAYYWGDGLNGDKANHRGDYPYGVAQKGAWLERTTPVGAYEGKAKHPWGLCDMSGNVFEWCDNLYSSEQTYRTVRGGSWGSGGHYCRGAFRSWGVPADADDVIGFRLLLPLD